MGPSLRCSNCGISWPNIFNEYGKCPECEGKADPSNSDPIPEDEARSRKNHADFERYFERWEIERLRRSV